MIFKSEQIKQIAEINIHLFIDRSISFLRKEFPDWCKGKEDEELADFISLHINFARRYRILSAPNTQAMMRYFITYNLKMPLERSLLMLLYPDNLNEDIRVERLGLALSSGNYKLTTVNLDTDLSDLDKAKRSKI